jgi:segregation and condensation protein A
MESRIPWWRRALDFALSGLRGRFGWFARSGKPQPEATIATTVVNARAEEETRKEQEAAEPELEVEAVDFGTAQEELAKLETAEVEPESIVIDSLGTEAPVEMEVIQPEPVEVEDMETKGPETEIVATEAARIETIEASGAALEADFPAIEPPQFETEARLENEVIRLELVAGEVENQEEEKTQKETDLTDSSPQSDAVLAKSESLAEPEETAAQTMATADGEALPHSEASPSEPVTPEAAEPVRPEAASADVPADSEQGSPAQPEADLGTEVSADAEPAAPAELAPEPNPTKPVSESKTIEPEIGEAKTAEQKTADKVAAILKARGQDAEQSPFSVIVSQVYDGPLDLLLDLIRKQDIDIYDIPIAKITAQFLAYVDRLRASDMDVAGEFIYTAALLIHIKSKMLLPRAPAGPDDPAEDPRRELVERLLEHERFKNAAQMLHEKQTLEAASWTNPGMRDFREDEGAEPEIAADTTDLVRIFRDILDRARNRPILNLQEDTVTVGQMIQFLARRLTMEDKPIALRRVLTHATSERGLIAVFLALLEMVRLQAILLRQDRHFSEIFIKKHTGFEAAMNRGLAEARDDWR